MRECLVKGLEREYSNETVSRHLANDIRRYIGRVDSISYEYLENVKMLLKKTRHLAAQDISYLVDDIEGEQSLWRLSKVFDFGLEAIELLRLEKKKGWSVNHTRSLESHMLGDIAVIANIIYNKTGDLEWGDEWLDCWSEAGELTAKYELDYSCMSESNARFVALTLFNDTADHSYKFDSYHHMKRLTKLKIDDGDLAAASRNLFTASIVMQELFEHFNDVSYAERSYADRRRAAEMRKKYNPLEAAKTYRDLARLSGRIGEKTRDAAWYELQKKNMRLAAKMAVKLDPGAAADCWVDLGYMFRKDEELAGVGDANIEYLMEQAKCFHHATILYAEADDHYQRAQLLRMSANVERLLYRKTDQYKHVRKARKQLQGILDLFDEHPELENQIFRSRVENSLADLYAARMKTNRHELRLDNRNKVRPKRYKGRKRKTRKRKK